MSKRAPFPISAKADDTAKMFWTSLANKANPEIAREAATAEFPLKLEGMVVQKTVAADDHVTDAMLDARAKRESESTGKVNRRSLFKFAGGGIALATLEGCRRPVEKLVPYTKQVEYSTPGISYHYATSRVERGEVIGILAEVHENRPTKLEGNPDHPANRGKSDLRTQASVFDLYDPDRVGDVTRKDGDKRTKASKDEWTRFFADTLKKSAGDTGTKMRFLVPPSVSPTFLRLRDAVKAKFPHARFHTYSAVNESNVREGARIAFGQAVNVIHDFAQAKTILSLDSDFLQTEAGMLRNTRAFTIGRKVHQPSDGMSRLYVVEPHFTTTGGNADHRLRLAARDIEGYLLALCKELATKGAIDFGALAPALADAPVPAGVPAMWISTVAKEIVANKGRSVIVVGSRQPARVHALAHAANAALGNIGPSVHLYATTDVAEIDQSADIKQLAADIDANQVDTLFVFGGNPAFDAPADLGFAAKLAKVPTTVRLSTHLDETAKLCTWHVPQTHVLEEWGDARALDGTISFIQPMIAPLHGGTSENELLAAIADEAATTGSEVVKATLRSRMPTQDRRPPDRIFDNALKQGILQGAMSVPFGATAPKLDDILAAVKAGKASANALSTSNLEVNFLPDPRLLDGRHANNPWLLELPDPMNKLVWDNAAFISQTTAKALGVDTGDVIKLGKNGGGSLAIPVCVSPGQADNSITVHLGWGRTDAGRFGGNPEFAGEDRFAFALDEYPIKQFHANNGHARGFNAYPLRTSDAMGFADGFTATKTGQTYKLVTTHDHHSMEGRPIAIDTTLEDAKANPDFTREKSPDPKVLPLWTTVEYKEHKWGMAIDLSTCTGCNACVIACQAENNIAIVGKDQVSRGREMSWMRIDRYFLGNDEIEPQVAYQPVACVHCEQAPCENVCPVNATEHSPEGLNDMAYNRCIGTRYCANNCPYKVRRFNFLEWQGDPLYGDLPETIKMQFNPNVTVRMRGVMEKCSYCVQRIEEGRISARRDGRTMRDGDVVSACAQACPTNAIVFGDLNDKESTVSHLHQLPRGYHLLAELGTHPRTLHLGKIRNPNPEMVKA